MNRGTLPIISRLQSLQMTARIVPGGARVIAEVSDSSPLTALLSEVNETMLGRSLTFQSGSGSSLTLEVSGRRVLRLTAVQGIDEAESCLAAPALEDEHKDALIKLLQTVAAPRQELRVITSGVGREGEGVSVGLPVALLADLLLVDLNRLAQAEPAAPEAEPQPPAGLEPEDQTAAAETLPDRVTLPASGAFLDRFAQAVGPTLMAWLIVGGEGDGTTEGPEEMVDHLKGFLEDEGEALSLQFDQITTAPGGPICIVLGATLAEGHSILCARSGDSHLLGVIEGDGTQTLLRAWAAALA